jgi:hypothetical protein
MTEIIDRELRVKIEDPELRKRIRTHAVNIGRSFKDVVNEACRVGIEKIIEAHGEQTAKTDGELGDLQGKSGARGEDAEGQGAREA